MPRASSRSSASPGARSSCAVGQDLACGCRVALELAADHAEPERDRDEPLLGAVMQVALEAPALGVADLDDARPGRGQLLVGVGVGQRLRDEVGEVAQPLLETFAQRLLGRRHRRQHAPQPAADADRSGHAGPVADAAQRRRERPARLARSARRAAPGRCGPPSGRACRRRGRASRRPGSAACRPRSTRRRPSPYPARRAASRSRRGARAVARPPRSPARRRGWATHRRRPAWRPGAAPPARRRARAAPPRRRQRACPRARSAVTAARTSEVIAEVAMNSCVASRLSVIESRTNGPSLCAVFHTVIEQTTRIAVAAPRGPKRSAAHSSTGKTMKGTSRCGDSSARTASTSDHDRPLEELAPANPVRARRDPGQQGRGHHEDAGRVAEHPGAHDPPQLSRRR